ncbi:hypothetical protein KJZ99_05190 [bacterium]|nr:hypothetical protein [bacterium]
MAGGAVVFAAFTGLAVLTAGFVVFVAALPLFFGVSSPLFGVLVNFVLVGFSGVFFVDLAVFGLAPFFGADFAEESELFDFPFVWGGGFLRGAIANFTSLSNEFGRPFASTCAVT